MNKDLLLEDYGKALQRLEEALARPAADELVQAGCIQYFEFTFELAWKTAKALCEHAGLQNVGSPRTALRQAFKQGWIEEEAGYMTMLEARNRMSHTDQPAHALDVYAQLPGFARSLRRLYDSLKHLDLG